MLYTLLFVDDQVIITGEKDNAIYMLKKLNEEHDKWGLNINFDKSVYLKVANEEKENLNMDGRVVKGCKSFKYLGIILTSNAKSLEDINNRIGQGKRAIKQLNSVLSNVELTRNTKKKKKHILHIRGKYYNLCVWGGWGDWSIDLKICDVPKV